MKPGWKTSTLGEACEFLNRGISPKYLKTGGIQVLNQKCVRDHKVDFKLARRHDNIAKKISENRLLRAGDVLVNSTGTGTLGRVAQIRNDSPEPTTVDSHITIVRPKPGVFHPDYFGYLLIGIEEQIKEAGEGTSGQTELARSVLTNTFKIHYPTSIAEQRRIVGILDKTLAAVAAAKVDAEHCLQESESLMQSYLDSLFKTDHADWARVSLGAVCSLISGQHINSSDYNTEGKGVPYLTGPSDFGYRNPTVTKWTEKPKVFAEPGDILITVKGSGVGKINMLADRRAAISRQLMAIRVEKSRRDLVYAFLSTRYRYFQSLRNGAAIPGISRENVLSLEICLPPSEQQAMLMPIIRELEKGTASLRQKYIQKLDAFDELKQSILGKAFFGDFNSSK